MLLLKTIRWKNLLATGNAFIEIKLNKNHTTIFLGKSGDGKSTLLDALSFALYNKPFRDIKKPNLVNIINQGQCVVELEFELYGKEYFIRRGIKPNIFELYCDGILVNQDANKIDYQEYLEKHILKM